AERFRELLTTGEFFVKHGKFGKPHVRFVWLSHDLGTIMWRCAGHKDVKGSVPVDSFTAVSLACDPEALEGFPKTTRAGSLATSPMPGAASQFHFPASDVPTPRALFSPPGAGGNALKQIVLFE
ncbi:unnamed protein product, partial [Discosporangium mesarthrocarpum]